MTRPHLPCRLAENAKTTAERSVSHAKTQDTKSRSKSGTGVSPVAIEGEKTGETPVPLFHFSLRTRVLGNALNLPRFDGL